MVSLTNTRPLAGQRILVTRARSQASDLVAKIQAFGGEVYAFPVITITDPESWAPVDQAIGRLEAYRWLVITSTNGAERFMDRLAACGRGPEALSHLKVAAVGKATARALERLGCTPDLMPAQFRGTALVEALGPLLAPGDRVLMTRGDLADPAPAASLRAIGAVVDDLVIYRTLLEGGDVAELKQMLQSGAISYATFTSGSTVRNLLARLGDVHWLDGVRIAVIGPETRKAAEAAGLKVDVIAGEATIDELVAAIARDFSG